MKGVVAVPDISPAARDGVFAGFGIEFHGARFGDLADLSLIGENSEIGLRVIGRAGGEERANERGEDDDEGEKSGWFLHARSKNEIRALGKRFA
jgi:hypothetical protein